MKKLALALLLALFSCLAGAEEALLLHVGTLEVVFPAAWKFQRSGQRAEGKGPDGESVVVSYRVLNPGAPPEVVEQHWNVIRNFAHDEMPGIAASRNGKVLRPVSEVPRQDKRVQFSSVSKNSAQGADQYLLQYLLGSSRLIAYFTVEGSGDPLEAAARFEKILATQRWQE